MALTLLQNATAMAMNLTLPFEGTDGVEPYTYSVLSGGIGGTINASTGLYHSPNKTGVDTVRVTDSNAAIAQSTILVANPLELFCDVIENQLSLSQGQVYLWNQKLNIPTDSRLYIAIGILSCKPFGNSNKLDENGDSIQSVNMQATLSIDIISRGSDARDRKEEVVLALLSDYAQSQQELNSFCIGRLPVGFANLSEIDGAAIPYRFNVTVPIQYFVTKTSSVPYFDTFEDPEIFTNS